MEGRQSRGRRMLIHSLCSYWQVQFFGNAGLLDKMRFQLRYDPDIVRYTILKRGDSLHDYIRP